MHTKFYKAKILLFGEYTIINGYQALAIPISQFGGKWAYKEVVQSSNLKSNLDEFVEYLDEMIENDDLLFGLDLRKFKQELKKGLYFHSTIPQGYGAGSSGALCAAVFDRFSNNEKVTIQSTHLIELRKKLAQLESFFHGSSSGIDPLISYLDQPVLTFPKESKVIQLPKTEGTRGAIFLLDTGIERKTEPFVKIFLEKYASPSFAKACDKQLALYNESAIHYFVEGDWDKLMEVVASISSFQLNYFEEMIPRSFSSLWKEGIKNDLFKLKLCGAGGGGFILGFTKDFEQLSLTHPKEKMIPILRF